MNRVKNKLVLLALLVLLIPSIKTYAEEITPYSNVGIVSVETGAPVYNVMDISSDMVTVLELGTPLQISGMCDGWYQVVIGEGIFYIPSGFLTTEGTQTTIEEPQTTTEEPKTNSDESSNPIYQDNIEYTFNSVQEGARCIADALAKHATSVRLKTTDIYLGYSFVGTFGLLGSYDYERLYDGANWVYNSRYGDQYWENDHFVYMIDADIIYKDSVAEEMYVEQVVDAMLPEVLSQGSQYEQMKYVHDFICNTVTYNGYQIYDNGFAEYYFDSAYNCLADKQAVCTGYSLLFQKFMEKLGIQSYVLANEEHMWNVVNYEGTWYQVDVTWDDTDAGPRYDYFLFGYDVKHLAVTNLLLSNLKHII